MVNPCGFTRVHKHHKHLAQLCDKVQYEIDGLSCKDQHQLKKTAICTIFVSYFAFGDRITDILQRLPPACGKTNWLRFQPVGKSSNQQTEYQNNLMTLMGSRVSQHPCAVAAAIATQQVHSQRHPHTHTHTTRLVLKGDLPHSK